MEMCSAVPVFRSKPNVASCIHIICLINLRWLEFRFARGSKCLQWTESGAKTKEPRSENKQQIGQRRSWLDSSITWFSR